MLTPRRALHPATTADAVSKRGNSGKRSITATKITKKMGATRPVLLTSSKIIFFVIFNCNFALVKIQGIGNHDFVTLLKH